MAEYIEREAFERALVEVYQGLGGYKTRDAFYKAIDIAHSFPKSDVAPVRHERWTWNEKGETDWEQFYRCSNCGDKEYWESNFCPNCGAAMDLEE